MENVRKPRDIKIVKTGRGRSYLMSESNCHTRKWFLENLLIITINERKVRMNQSIQVCQFRIKAKKNQNRKKNKQTNKKKTKKKMSISMIKKTKNSAKTILTDMDRFIVLEKPEDLLCRSCRRKDLMYQSIKSIYQYTSGKTKLSD